MRMTLPTKHYACFDVRSLGLLPFISFAAATAAVLLLLGVAGQLPRGIFLSIHPSTYLCTLLLPLTMMNEQPLNEILVMTEEQQQILNR